MHRTGMTSYVKKVSYTSNAIPPRPKPCSEEKDVGDSQRSPLNICLVHMIHETHTSKFCSLTPLVTII